MIVEVCDYDEQDDDYWHCYEPKVGKTKCCGFAYCLNHAWIAEEHETAGIPLLGCNGGED